jgi:hypothetical protein
MNRCRHWKRLSALLTFASAAALSLGVACSQTAGTSNTAPVQPEPAAARAPSSPAPQVAAKPVSTKAYVCPMECEVALENARSAVWTSRKWIERRSTTSAPSAARRRTGRVLAQKTTPSLC